MKKSILYFSIATALGLCLMYFPSLSGSAVIDQKLEPVGFLSKFWIAKKSIQLKPNYPEQVQVIKITGNSKTISLNLADGPNSYFSNNLRTFRTSLDKDTLHIYVNNDAYLRISNTGKLQKIILSQANAHIKNLIQNKDIALEVNNASQLTLEQGDKQVQRETRNNLSLLIQGKSTVNLVNGSFKAVHAQLSDAALTYSNKLALDSAFVQLQGRSNVKSTEPGSIQELNTLVLSGNKQFFNAALLGKNVSLLLKD